MAPRRRGGTNKSAASMGDEEGSGNNNNNNNKNRAGSGGNSNGNNNNNPDYGDEVEELPPLVSEDIAASNDHHHLHHHHNNSTSCNNISNIINNNLNAAAGSCPGGGGGGGSDNNACLHCHAPITQRDHVQVRCDECGSSICHGCHWCHEFQANHEIRVCDRCDAFYCRSCDEMDQCDDCGEVVCAACSTLLSCKFCGGGLCEDCATACGRCGIVLCSRDAKFAVDCDTCRLSYCLVCLASGSKDPCVRCGHRPSKRMEQLVHLRLKSIYKAFKQSSGTGSPKTKSSANVRDRQNDDPDECHHVAEDPEALLQAAAASAAKNSHSRNRSRNRHSSDRGTSPRGGTTSTSSTNSDDEDERELYIAQKQKADAAAAALLAELEEEEEAAKTKKSKKKKKKKKHQLKKEEEMSNPASAAAVDSLPGAAPSPKSEPQRQSPLPDEEDDDDYDDEEVLLVNEHGKLRPKKAESVEVSETTASSDSRGLNSSLSQFEKATTSTEEEGKQPASDPLEETLCALVADEDIEGLEEFLASVKGVPGLATLRKNAKKALKRFRAAAAEAEPVAVNPEGARRSTDDTTKDAVASEVPMRARTPIHGDNGLELLKIIAHTHSKPHGRGGGGGGPNSNRTECIMHISPLIVGWIIGKGGQKIRDLMEETGARIWIDQDSKGPTDPRTAYVSGHRKNVDCAVLRITELVSKAPTATGSRHYTPDAEEAGTAAATKPPPAAGKHPPPIPDSEHLSSSDPHSSYGLKPRVSSTGGGAGAKSRSEHIMTCDPRFVPLLIGRRGWTIKNIQDSSGARVDIDQTVTPRKISISGTADNVEAAIQMVNDVLSYPHAQLQGSLVGEEAVTPPPTAVNEIPAATTAKVPEKDGAIAAAAAAAAAEKKQQDAAVVPEPNSPVDNSAPMENARRQVHSPPSSLIMTADAKSTISASSSLSSTPEPSMNSSSTKSNSYLQVPPGPMLPPAFGFGSYNPTPGEAAAAAAAAVEVAPQQQQPQAPLPNGPIFPPQAGAQAAPPPPQDSSLFGMTSSPAQIRPQVQPGSDHPPALAELVGSPTQQPPFPMGRSGVPAFHQQHSSGSLRGPMPGPIPGVHHQQQGAFHPTQAGFPMPIHSSQATAASLLNDESNHSNRVLPNRGLWEGPNGQPTNVMPGAPLSNPAKPTNSQGFQLDAAVEFLQHSNNNRTTEVLGGVNEAIGLPPPPTPAASDKQQDGIDRTTRAPTNPILNTEDSRMIDSLFGPSNTVCTSANDSSLLAGLQGLSIGKDNGIPSSGSELWGSAVVGGEELKGFQSLSGVTEPKSKSTSHLFQTDPVGHQDPPRFGWGAFAGGQQ